MKAVIRAWLKFYLTLQLSAKRKDYLLLGNTSLNSHIWRDHSQKKMEDVKSWPVDKSLSFFTQTNYLQSENASADNVKTYYSPGYLVSQLCFSGC